MSMAQATRKREQAAAKSRRALARTGYPVFYCEKDVIERRAYELYLARHGGDGRALEDWLQAERELQEHGGPLFARVRELFAAGEAKKPDEFVTFFTQEARYRFGNSDVMQGRAAIRETVAKFFPLVRALYHDVRTVWEWSGTVFLEMDVIYTTHKKRTITLPCADIFRFQGRLIQDMRIYMDPGPLLAAD